MIKESSSIALHPCQLTLMDSFFLTIVSSFLERKFKPTKRLKNFHSFSEFSSKYCWLHYVGDAQWLASIVASRFFRVSTYFEHKWCSFLYKNGEVKAASWRQEEFCAWKVDKNQQSCFKTTRILSKKRSKIAPSRQLLQIYLISLPSFLILLKPLCISSC